MKSLSAKDSRLFGVSRAIAAALFIAALPACANTQDMLAQKGKGGRAFTCLASYDRVYDATVQALEQRDFKIIIKDKREGTIVASDKIRFLNGGGRVAIFIERVDPSTTRLELHSKPAFFMPIPTSYLAAEQRISKIHEGIHSVLGS